MNLSNIRRNVHQDLSEANIGNERVTGPQLLELVNEGYERVCADALALVRNYTVAAVVGTRTYDLPDDFVGIRCVLYGSGTTPLTATTTQLLGIETPSWRGAGNSTPTHFFLYDQRSFGVYPEPDGTSNFTVEMYCIPSSVVGGIALLSADSDTPAFTAQFHPLLVHYTVAALCSRYLADNPTAAQKLAAAKEDYARLLAAMQTFYATGVGVVPILAP